MNVDEMRPQSAPLQDIRAGAQSAKGLREENQDAMTRFRSRYGEVILVADGMGGHQGGAVASDTVVKRFRGHLEAMPENMPLADALQHAAARVNDEIYERGHSGDAAVANMGSTLVLVCIRQGPNGMEAIAANAGDSRAYLVRDGQLHQITKDHTAAQRMVDAGILSAASARSHPQGSVLTRALGQQPGATVETYAPVPLQGGDGLLLCSDGLSGYVLDPDIQRIVASASDPNAAVRDLIELALKSGSDDNITVQFLRLGEKAAPAAMPLSAMPASQIPSGPLPIPSMPPPRSSGTSHRHIGLALAILAVFLAGAAYLAKRAWFSGNVTSRTTEPVTGTHHQTTTHGDNRGGTGVHNPTVTTDHDHDPGDVSPAPQGHPTTTTPSGGGADGARTSEPGKTSAPTTGPAGGHETPPGGPPPISGGAEHGSIEVHVPKGEHPAWLDKVLRRGWRLQVLETNAPNFDLGGKPMKIWYRSKEAYLTLIAEVPELGTKDKEQMENLPPGVDVLIVVGKTIHTR